MRIIHQVTPGPFVIESITCLVCRSELEVEETDLFKVDAPPAGMLTKAAAFICVVCKKTNVIPTSIVPQDIIDKLLCDFEWKARNTIASSPSVPSHAPVGLGGPFFSGMVHRTESDEPTDRKKRRHHSPEIREPLDFTCGGITMVKAPEGTTPPPVHTTMRSSERDVERVRARDRDRDRDRDEHIEKWGFR